MGNELKLSLENFQSISKGELIFHTGTTVIIGQSNSGKSATFRALKACLMNPAGSQRFIKKGHSCAEVSLEYNGNIIIWKRTKSESSYEINGEKYVKTGKSNVFNILDNTGFARDYNDNIMNTYCVLLWMLNNCRNIAILVPHFRFYGYLGNMLAHLENIIAATTNTAVNSFESLFNK